VAAVIYMDLDFAAIRQFSISYCFKLIKNDCHVEHNIFLMHGNATDKS